MSPWCLLGLPSQMWNPSTGWNWQGNQSWYIVSGTTRPELWPANHRPQRIVTCGNYDEWLELVVTGHGVGTLPKSAARTATHPSLRFVALTGAPPVSIWLAYQPRRLNPWGRRFLTVAIAVSIPYVLSQTKEHDS